MMKNISIAIIGAGKVGQALGRSWSHSEHTVVFGVREPDAAAARQLAESSGCSVTSIANAVRSSQVLLMAIPSSQIEPTLKQLQDLSGKVILDCSNPQSPVVHHQELPPYTLVERLAEAHPAAHFVKIFNTVGFEVLANPVFEGVPASMFYCCDGDDEGRIAHHLAADAGFVPLRLGGLKQSRMLEDLTRFWGALAYGAHQGRGIALKLLRREERG